MKTKQSIVETNKHLLRKNATKSELRFKEILTELGLNYVFQKGLFRSDVAFIVDFYLPKYKTVIEIDGEYHFNEKQKQYDLYRENYLRFKRRFAVIRFSNKYLSFQTNNEILLILNGVLSKIKRSDKLTFY